MRKMSASIQHQNEGSLPTNFEIAEDAHSDLGDGSSSLSDIEDKEAEQDDIDDQDEQDDQDDQDNQDLEDEDDSDANESEAETERLENSPHNQRKLKDVVLSSQAESRTYERSPSKLQHQYEDEDEEEEDDNDVDHLSDEEGSIAESIKSIGLEDGEQDPTTATTSLEDSSGEGRRSATALEAISKKRKRSLLPERGLTDATDLDEPARKRTGSIAAEADDYAIEDIESANGEVETSNPISGDISDVESHDPHDDEEDDNHDHAQDEAGVEDELDENTSHAEDSRPKTERSNNRKVRDRSDNIDTEQEDLIDGSASNDAAHEAGDGEEHEGTLNVDGDEVEIALKNEEEQEKKRIALEQLSDIERHFTSFRDRLYEERLAELEKEEAMLRQDNPTHPGYLAMLQSIDARRDDKLRIQERLVDLKLESIKRSAVGRRSQILTQFYQEVRDIREKKLELLGKQWYDIQHDRRGHGSNVDDYVLKFPTRKSQQISNQIAYNTEVSITSGIAKYVGFPAAPQMATVTAAQAEQDAEQINMMKLKSQRNQPEISLQNLGSIRAAASTSNFKPAEEFINTTPWANPQHPSHAHMLQRQASAHQAAARTSSPFSIPTTAQTRRHSHQHAISTPVVGTFSSTTSTVQPQSNGAYIAGGRISPLNPFTNPSNSQKVAPSPLGSRRASQSPPQSHQQAVHTDQPQPQEAPQSFSLGSSHAPFPGSRNNGLGDTTSGFAHDPGASVKREQAVVTNGRY